MSTALASPAVHAPRRCFRWDLDVDPSKRVQADTRTWLNATPRRLTPVPELADPEVWAANMSRAVIEAALGSRPITQLQRWMVPPLYAALEHLQRPQSPATGRTCRPVSWRSYSPKQGVVEVATVIAAPDRTCIVALRLESVRGRWMTTALEFA